MPSLHAAVPLPQAVTPSPFPDWRGRTCVVAASGPSLTDAQAEAIEANQQCTCIVTNTSYQKFLAPDVVYGCDFLWWKVNMQAVKDHYRGNSFVRYWTQDRAAAERFGLNYVRHESREGLGRTALRTGGNSGYGAVNLAYLFGAKRILLIGFDMKEGPKGEKHWHPDHPKPLVQKQQFHEWIHKFKALADDLKAAGVEVINCTPGSALKCFPTGDLETELTK